MTRAASCTSGSALTTTSRRTVLARDEVDDALIGELRHDQIGERSQRRVGIERARELLADRGQQAERAAAAALGVVHARALERVRALLAERDREGALGGAEDVAALEAEAERAERALARRAAAARRSGAPRPPLSGKRVLALALVEEHGLAGLDRLADRRPAREREVPPVATSSSANPYVATSSTLAPSSTGQRHDAGVGAQQLAALAERRRRRRPPRSGRARARR